MNIAKFVVMISVLGASFCYGRPDAVALYLMSYGQVEALVSHLNVTKEELSQAQSFHSAQKNGLAWKVINARFC